MFVVQQGFVVRGTLVGIIQKTVYLAKDSFVYDTFFFIKKNYRFMY